MDEIKRAREVARTERENEEKTLSAAIEAVMYVVDMYRSEKDKRIIISRGLAKATEELDKLRAENERLNKEVNALSMDLDSTKKLLEDTQD